MKEEMFIVKYKNSIGRVLISKSIPKSEIKRFVGFVWGIAMGNIISIKRWHNETPQTSVGHCQNGLPF